MSETMEISQETLQTIGSYVKGNLAQWIREISPSLTVQLSPEVTERLVRIEDSIEKQQALMEQGFGQMEKRFEQVDKRFEEQHQEFVSRFEQVDKRFEQVDKRFEELREDMNRRFQEQREDSNQRFEDVHKQINRQTAIIGAVLAILTFFATYGRFFS